VRFLWLLIPVACLSSVHAETNIKNSESTRAGRLTIAALQIALDNEGFSTGIIDGRNGAKTKQALELALVAGKIIKPDSKPWITINPSTDLENDVCEISKSWKGKSEMKRLGFEGVREKLAETYHVSVDFLQYLNPNITDWDHLTESITLKLPALSNHKLPKADYLIVNLSLKNMIAYREPDEPIALFPCSIAAKKEKRPVGQLEVKSIVPNPDYLFDPALFSDNPDAVTMKSKLMIPSGPNNPVGEMWIGLNLKGYGIHGTPNPEDIGKTESHGCFRLTNWDAKRLASIIKVGTLVFVEE
jgi:hypothetical protein